MSNISGPALPVRAAALKLDGGSFQHNHGVRTMNSHPFVVDNPNKLGTSLIIDDTAPITGTDFCGVQLGGGLDFSDDMGVSAFGLGWNSAMYLPIVSGKSGKTITKASLLTATALFGITGSETGGTISEFNYMNMVAPVTAGAGTPPTLTDVFVFRASTAVGAFPGTTKHGLYLEDDGFTNWMAGFTSIGGSSYVAPTRALEVRGDGYFYHDPASSVADPVVMIESPHEFGSGLDLNSSDTNGNRWEIRSTGFSDHRAPGNLSFHLGGVAADVLTNDDEVLVLDQDGSVHIFAGSFSIEKEGHGVKIKEGSNAKMGVATLVAGTVTVSTTAVTATSRIYLTVQTVGGTQGFLAIANVVAATSFDINSTDIADTSTVAWLIVEPA
jgi:hypothetical protein